MKNLRINGRFCIVDDKEDFFRIMSELMGDEAVEYCRSFMPLENNDDCECDKLYRIEEHYQRIIKDAIDGLNELKLPACSAQRLKEIIHRLEMEV